MSGPSKLESISDSEIVAAVETLIAGRAPAEMLRAMYLDDGSAAPTDALHALANLVPAEQISAVRLVARLNPSNLHAILILLATLRKVCAGDAWIHYNLSKHLSPMFEAGVQEAKLPAIIHSLLALDGLGAHRAPSPFRSVL